MEKIMATIKKLLELQKSPNENEAKAAALKAQELMQKHNIELTDLQKDKKVESIHQAVQSKGKAYRFRLADIISHNYAVKHYFLGKMIVAFYGNPVNVETAVSTFDYLHNVIHRLADSYQTKVYKQTKNTKGAYNSYVDGFLDGLKAVLDENCKALQIVISPEVETDFKEFSKDFGSFSAKGMTITSFDEKAYKEGFDKAKEVQATKQVGNKTKTIKAKKGA